MSETYLEMCELEAEEAEVMLEAYNEYSALESRADNLRAYVNGDLAVFDEEANSSKMEKAANLAKRAWDAVVKFAKAIKEKVFEVIGKIKCKIDPNTKVYAVPKEYADKGNISKLNQVVTKIKGIDGKTTAKVVLAIVAALGIVCVGLKTKKKMDELKSLNASLTNMGFKGNDENRELRGHNAALEFQVQQERGIADARKRRLKDANERINSLKGENSELQKKLSAKQLALSLANDDIDDLRYAAKILDSDYANKVRSEVDSKGCLLVTDSDLSKLAAMYQTTIDVLIKAIQCLEDEAKICSYYTASVLKSALKSTNSDRLTHGQKVVRKAMQQYRSGQTILDVLEESASDNISMQGAFTKLREKIMELLRTLKEIGNFLLHIRTHANR